MTTKTIIQNMEKELSKKMDTFVGEGGFRIGCYECEDAIDRSSLKPFIHSYTKSLLEAFAKEVIGKYEGREVQDCPHCGMEQGQVRDSLKEEQRLKVKEILEVIK